MSIKIRPFILISFERILTLNKTPLRCSSIFGLGKPFATSWGLVLLFGPLVYILYRALIPIVLALFGVFTASAYPILVFYGPAFVLLGAMFLLHMRFFPDITFRGSCNLKDAVNGVIAVTLVYLAAYVAAHLLGQPREPIMVNLYTHKTGIQVVVLIVTMLLLPPFVEELAFRHFILSALPFNANVGISWVAVVLTALLFVYAHSYIYLTTQLLMFALAIIFGRARIHSRGLVLPIGLHTYAIALGLACNQLTAYLES